MIAIAPQAHAQTCSAPTFGNGVDTTPSLDALNDYARCLAAAGQGCNFVIHDTDTLNTCLSQSGVVPCVQPTDCHSNGNIVPNAYFQSGFDVVFGSIAYDRANATLFLGFRVAGQVGDSDGDGTDSPGNCPTATITDPAGIGVNAQQQAESYVWNITCGPANNVIHSYSVKSGANGANFVVTDFGVPIASGATGGYNVHDLEVRISNVVLPANYGFGYFVQSNASGLSANALTVPQCTVNPRIHITKTANPTALCPGGSTTFSLAISNPGDVPLTNVTLTDNLPAGLAYVAASTGGGCGAGEPQIAGQLLTWTIPGTMNPGASCTLTFQAVRNNATCSGDFVNPAHVEGTATFCGPQGSLSQTVFSDDQFTVTCLSSAAVSVVCAGANPVCNGATASISGTATNTGSANEDIVVTLVGPSGTIGSSQTFPNVAPGASVTHTEASAAVPCPGGLTFHANATASVTGQTTICHNDNQNSDACNVGCLSEAAVLATCSPSTQAVCGGATVSITGTAQNTGTVAEDITISIVGPSGTIGSSETFNAVPAGETRSHTESNVAVTCPGGLTFHANATASVTGQSSVCKNGSSNSGDCQVTCLTPHISISKTCTPSNVAVGGTINYSITVTNNSGDPNLTGVVLTDVQCADVSAPTTFGGSCPGAGNATYDATSRTITWPAFDLAAGASCTVTYVATLNVCNASCTNTADVVGYCGTTPARASTTCTTHCAPPGRCWATGGGQSYDAKGHLHSYGGVINPGCSPTAAGGGNWNDLDHTNGAHFKGLTIQVVHCGNLPGIPAGSLSPKTDFNYILWTGQGTMFPPGANHGTKVTFYGFFEDRHEPASAGQPDQDLRDRYFLQVMDASSGAIIDLVDKTGNGLDFGALLAGSPDFDNVVAVAIDADAVIITHGNLQLHQSGCDKLKNSPLTQPQLAPGEANLDQSIDDGAFPTEVSFGMPRPNPAGTMTSLRYGLPKEATVSAKVYDVAGRVVRDFGEYALGAGWHEVSWNLQGESGQKVGPGLYFLRISVDGQAQTKVITVVR